MRPHEIIRSLSAAEVAALVVDACQDDSIPDKIAGGVLTYQNIPLKRFAKLPEETRRAYVRRTLRDKRASDLDLYVLSAALTKGKAPMIEAFLDALGFAHDGPNLAIEGEIPEPSKTKLTAALNALLKTHPGRDVAVYLHAFAAQPDVHWPSLEARLASDERLMLEDRSGE